MSLSKMLSYEYINKEWFVSPRARCIYRISAALSLAFLAFLIAIQLPFGLLGMLRPVLRPLVLVGVLASAITVIGMEYFLIRFDDSRPLTQVVWFVAMLFVPLGAALYCFIVYSRSGVLKNARFPGDEELAP